LEKTPDIRLIFEADSGTLLLQQLEKASYDVVLLDLMMPGKDTFEVIMEIKARYPMLPIVILTALSEEENAIQLFKAGVMGYCNKENGFGEIAIAIRCVYAGKKYIAPKTAQIMAQKIIKNEEESLPHERLSSREYQVFLLLAKGKSITDIATDLNLSVKTISTYRTRIIEKTGLDSNALLAVYAVKNRLL